MLININKNINLNYSVIATPAEGLPGRFTRMDVKKYEIISGVNDSNYYINSFHVDVKQNISIFEKIKKEVPFHAITLDGHISYVELDGAMKYKIPVILKILKCIFDNNIGYGSINHPVDVCLECQFSGIIPQAYDKCQSNNIRRIRQITGYLTGDLNSWNSAKRSEEHDRVKHGINENK
ncbi:anaerobic ribonucleoside-triphosphate reductase [Spiroplasma mirum]|nr:MULTISPECIES: anaerobic ribonucleoside-triphosphate reductase [Spiroplasma]